MDIEYFQFFLTLLELVLEVSAICNMYTSAITL